MRVLVFHQYFSTREGSTITRVYEIVRGLVERGHEVTVVTATAHLSATGLAGPFAGGRREGMVDGIRVIELEGAYSNHLSFRRRTVEFLRYMLRSVRYALTRDCDLVVCKSAPLTASIPGILARLLRGKPYVLDVGDLWPLNPWALGLIGRGGYAALWLLEWLAYRTAALTIAVSPGVAAGIRARGVPESRIALIPNACDLDLFKPAEGERPSVPGIPEDAFLVVYTGAHGPITGLETVIEAARALDALGRRDIHLLLVGDGKLKPLLRARAEEWGLANVHFHDPLPKPRLAELMRRADAGLQVFIDRAVIHDTVSPNKFFDYVAAGLPVIHNYPGWVAELIVQEDVGLVVPPSDAAAMAAAMARLADDRAAARAMGRRGRALAERAFDKRQMTRLAVGQLERVVGLAGAGVAARPRSA